MEEKENNLTELGRDENARNQQSRRSPCRPHLQRNDSFFSQFFFFAHNEAKEGQLGKNKRRHPSSEVIQTSGTFLRQRKYTVLPVAGGLLLTMRSSAPSQLFGRIQFYTLNKKKKL